MLIELVESTPVPAPERLTVPLPPETLEIAKASDCILFGSVGDFSLDNLLLTDLSSVAAFFETKFEASDSNLKLLKNDTTLSYDFDLEVTVTDGAISSVSVDGDSSLFTISGSRIVGATGSIYEGLSFALANPTSGTISVTDLSRMGASEKSGAAMA